MDSLAAESVQQRPPDEELDWALKQFDNGDSYTGTVSQDGLPAGEGTYVWASDAGRYEGMWQNGLRHGVGQYTWRSGATYQGEWRGGRMHGVGTLEGSPSHTTMSSSSAPRQSVDRVKYQGGWHHGLKHGLGKQMFANGDMYEGLWRKGAPHGPGRYQFHDGSEYNGQWQMGFMHGSGTLLWASGERYDGHWKHGRPHGIGMLGAPDGSLSDCQWDSGVKHGVCLYKVPVHKGSATKSVDASTERMARLWSNRSSQSSPQQPSLDLQCVDSAPHGAHHNTHQPGALRATSQGGDSQHFRMSVREYDKGKLINEWVVAKEDVECLMPLTYTSSLRREKSLGNLLKRAQSSRESPDRMGESLVKGHRSYDAMLNIQLGIQYSVMHLSHQPTPRQLAPEDFRFKVKQFFPRMGSNITPVHSSEDFMWKDYAPMVFRKLRELFDVHADSYMDSLCSDAAVRMLNSPGKSGSVFFLSHDDRFFIKTIKRHEAKLLFSMLPLYYRHLSVHPHTLLTKFYGLHCIKRGQSKMHVCVMANVFTPNIPIDQKYDLKGSTLGRTGRNSEDSQSASATILKDLDLDVSFRLEPSWLERLEFQLRADCALLLSCQIMDYSLMIGVTYRDQISTLDSNGRAESLRPAHGYDEDLGAQSANEFSHVTEKLNKSRVPDDAKKCLLRLAKAKHLEGPGAQAVARRSQSLDLMDTHGTVDGLSTETTADHLALQLGLTHTQLGVNMPATAIPNDRTSGEKPREVVLSFGIIDILQEYNPTKRIEHGLKSLVHDSNSISVVHPSTYAQRFQSYLRSVFT